MMIKAAASLGLTCALLMSSILVGCGGADASSVGDPVASGDDDLTKGGPLSQDLVCAAVSAFNDNADPTGLTIIPEKNLKGDALSGYKSFQKGMARDYPSVAYALPVTLKGKTYTFTMVVEQNDGGEYAGIYRTDGRTVATFMQSESGDPDWSAPADKCK